MCKLFSMTVWSLLVRSLASPSARIFAIQAGHSGVKWVKMVGLWGALCLLQYCCCCADRRCNWVSMIATRFRVCLLDMRTIRGANIIIERGHHLMIACLRLRVSFASSERWGASTSRGSLWNTAAVQQWENYLADCNDLRDKREFVITLIKEVEAAEKTSYPRQPASEVEGIFHQGTQPYNIWWSSTSCLVTVTTKMKSSRPSIRPSRQV